MTVSSTTNRNDYTGNGAVDTYSYGFRIFANTELLVTVKNTSNVETTLTLTTDYTVTGVGDDSGGNVVLVSASQDWLDGDGDLLTGYTLTIRRVVPLTQTTDIRNQGSFLPESHEDVFDYLTMINQQQQDEIDRSMRNPESLPASSFDPTLPADINTAGTVLKVNDAGTGFEVGPTAADIASASANATAAAASAVAAATAETNAETAETNAETAETNAGIAQTAAEAAQAAAEAAGNALTSYVSNAAFVTAKGSAAANGDHYYNSTADKAKIYLGGEWTTHDTSNVQNVIYSGATRTGGQPQFITPNGAAASFTVDGAGTSLILNIDSEIVSVTTDITESSLTVGPSTTATCLVNDADAADQSATKVWGEVDAAKTSITVDNMGAEFSAYVGKYVAIQIAGVATEYAMAFVKSTTELTNIKRGYFTNSSGAPVNRTGFSNNDTITVLSTAWVFAKNDGTTIDVTYNPPVTSFTEPSSPATGDYWKDSSTDTWREYDGATYAAGDATLIGVVAIDSANCVAARSFDFENDYSDENDIEIALLSTTTVEAKNNGATINVYGNRLIFNGSMETWDITSHLLGSADMYTATEQASTVYYLYMKPTKELAISDISPYKRGDLRGHYHPHNPYRCVGMFYNDGSSNITLVDDVGYNPNVKSRTIIARNEQASAANGGSISTGSFIAIVLNSLQVLSGDFCSVSSNQVLTLPGRYKLVGKPMLFAPNSSASLIYDSTNSDNIIIGQSLQSTSGTTVGIQPKVEGEVVFSEPILLELHYQCNSATATFGQGSSAGFGVVERYSYLSLEKIIA